MPKKHMIDAPNNLWKRVKKFQIDKNLKNVNEAVLILLERGLLK
jgi:hypothetical protein